VDTLSVLAEAAPIGIPVEDRETAGRYIAAIMAGDRQASGDPGLAAWRTRQLWGQSGAEYGAITTGPYARQDQAALRIAWSLRRVIR
jgi:hypothetical protein